MRQYMMDLTNRLISKNRYRRLFGHLSTEEFLQVVKYDLEINDVRDMSLAELGEVLCSFEIGDVLASRTALLTHVHFNGDPEDTLRELVAACLTYAIHQRLNPLNKRAERREWHEEERRHTLHAHRAFGVRVQRQS